MLSCNELTILVVLVIIESPVRSRDLSFVLRTIVVIDLGEEFATVKDDLNRLHVLTLVGRKGLISCRTLVRNDRFFDRESHGSPWNRRFGK